MLTNLEFLRQGQPWPPVCERTRLSRYAENRRLFEGEHSEVYEKHLRRIQREVGSLRERIGYVVVPNYQRLISLKTADLLVGEPPEITEQDDAQAESITRNIQASGFQTLLYQAAIDLSRYGNALLTVRRDDSGKAVLGIGQPGTWFPVVSSADVKYIVYHVIAWVETIGRERWLHTQVHEKGRYAYTVYALRGDTIGEVTQDTQTFQTGLPGFAVFPLASVTTSDSVYGYDDYEPVDSLVSEIMVVIGNISGILDKHAQPSMSGPAGALEPDGQGGWQLSAGSYFVRDSQADAEVKYITWNGQLSAAFIHLKNLLEQLYVVSEMGEAILGTNNHQGVTTYKGLKLRMVPALTKVKRMAANITAPVKEALAAALGLDVSRLTIWWNDGLPDDKTEEMERMQLENGGKPTMSHLRSIELANNFTKKQALKELETILDEQASSLPLTNILRDPGDDDGFDL